MTDDTLSPLTEADNHDYAKYAYHQGARIIRAVADWISEATHTSTAPDSDDREQVYDMLIELHQLLYGVTLYPLHADDDFNDEVYDDGRPAISRIDLTGEPPALPIPAGAYHDIGAEALPFGCSIYVWRPGEADYQAEETDVAHPPVWAMTAEMHRQGLLDWTRDAKGRIVKRPNQYGRMSPASSITEAGKAKCETPPDDVEINNDNEDR
jgi:hypothetical protein